MSLKLVYDYKDNDVLRKSFNELAKKIFGISFESWYQKGLWLGNYICYSVQDEDKIVSNVSVTEMKLIKNEREKKIMQIGTVMTDPQYRGKGLAKRLMNCVIEKYEDEYNPFFLFANETVLDFYPGFGFEKGNRYRCVTRDVTGGDQSLKLRKLNMDDKQDVKILIDLVNRKIPISRDYFFTDYEGILYWYCLEILKNNIYYAENENLIVIYMIEDDKLHIYDLISTAKISYKKVLNTIQHKDTMETIFYFNLETDELDLTYRLVDEVEEDDYFFSSGDFDIDKIIYPITGHA